MKETVTQNPKIKSGNLFRDSWSTAWASDSIFYLSRFILVVQKNKKNYSEFDVVVGFFHFYFYFFCAYVIVISFLDCDWY